MSQPNGMGTAGIVAIPIPPNGNTGTVLTKESPLDYDMVWGSGGGSAGADGTGAVRALDPWFLGGINGKSIMYSGDSTTLQLVTALSPGLTVDGTPGRGQYWWPQLNQVQIFCRGINGMTLSGFLAGGGDPGYTLNEILGMRCDAYDYSWGINDVRVDLSVTASILEGMLRQLIERTFAAVPKTVIMLRVPNAFQTGSPLIFAPATAQNCMQRLATAYRALRGAYRNLLVYDQMSGSLWNNVAMAAGGTSRVIDTGGGAGLHPTQAAYDVVIEQSLRPFIPTNVPADVALSNETTMSCPLAYDFTNNVVTWHPNVSASVLEGPEWYKVYRVAFSDGIAGVYSRWQFTAYDGSDDAAQRDQAWSNGVPAPGLVPGDVISLQNRDGPDNTFVVNVFPALHFSTAILQYSGSASLAHPSGVPNQAMPAGNFTGFVYRNRNAMSDEMRYLTSALNPETFGEQQEGAANPFGIARRFYISSAGVGTITADTIGSEPSGDLSRITWNVTDTIVIPGVTAGLVAVDPSMQLRLTNASFAPDTANKRMVLTFGGADATIDFRTFTIPQGYLLQPSDPSLTQSVQRFSGSVAGGVAVAFTTDYLNVTDSPGEQFVFEFFLWSGGNNLNNAGVVFNVSFGDGVAVPVYNFAEAAARAAIWVRCHLVIGGAPGARTAAIMTEYFSNAAGAPPFGSVVPGSSGHNAPIASLPWTTGRFQVAFPATAGIKYYSATLRAI